MATQITATGANQFWLSSSAPATSDPFTLAVAFLPASGGSADYLTALTDGSSGSDQYTVWKNSTDDLNFTVYDGNGPTETVATSNTANAGAYNVGVAVEAASDDHRVRLNDGTQATLTDAETVVGITDWTVGMNTGSRLGDNEDTSYSYAACFDEALSDDQTLSLGLGFHPFQVDPYSLVSFVSFGDNTTETDLVGVFGLTQQDSTNMGPADGPLIGGPSVV